MECDTKMRKIEHLNKINATFINGDRNETTETFNFIEGINDKVLQLKNDNLNKIVNLSVCLKSFFVSRLGEDWLKNDFVNFLDSDEITPLLIDKTQKAISEKKLLLSENEKLKQQIEDLKNENENK